MFGVDAFGQRPEADLAAFEVLDGLGELLHRPSEASEPPDNERITGAHGVERGLQLGPIPLRAGSGLGADTLAPGLLQRTELESGVLVAG